jgi:hypothetical protein
VIVTVGEEVYKVPGFETVMALTAPMFRVAVALAPVPATLVKLTVGADV